MNTILVINALNGSIPLVLRKRYPSATITCAEVFPFFMAHLRKLGFVVVDWDSVGDMKFDLVIGNPPYQSEKGTGTQPLWPLFVHKAANLLNPDGTLTMITPNKWCGHTTNVIKGGVQLYRDVFKGKLTKVNIQECSKHFPGIGGYADCFSYFIMKDQKQDEFEAVTQTGIYAVKASDFEFLPLRHLDPTTASILQKVKTEQSYEFKQVSTGFTNQNNGSVVISMAQRIHYEKLNVYWDMNSKVIPTSKSTVSQKMFYKSSQNHVLAVFRSKLFRFLHLIYWNNDNFGTTFYNNLPYLDLNKKWTDDLIFSHFGISKLEKEFIDTKLS